MKTCTEVIQCSTLLGKAASHICSSGACQQVLQRRSRFYPPIALLLPQERESISCCQTCFSSSSLSIQKKIFYISTFLEFLYCNLHRLDVNFCGYLLSSFIICSFYFPAFFLPSYFPFFFLPSVFLFKPDSHLCSL